MQLTSIRAGLRPLLAAMALPALIALSGCSGSAPAPEPEETASVSTPPAPSTAEPEPEPSAVITYEKDAKVVTLGDVQVRATVKNGGIDVVCTLTNSGSESLNATVKVSVGDGTKWVTTNSFQLYQVPAGASESGSVLMARSFADDLPDDPSVYIDHVQYY